jgi:hypothetical protein
VAIRFFREEWNCVEGESLQRMESKRSNSVHFCLLTYSDLKQVGLFATEILDITQLLLGCCCMSDFGLNTFYCFEEIRKADCYANFLVFYLFMNDF